MKKVLAVSEFTGGAFDSSEPGISGARPEIHAASMLSGSEYFNEHTQQLVFFTVIESHISRAVRVKVRGQQSLSGVQVVTVHPLLTFRPCDKICIAGMSPMTSVSFAGRAAEAHVAMTMHPATLSTESLLTMYCWEPSPRIALLFSSICKVPGEFEEDVPKVLRVLSVSPEGAPADSFTTVGSRNLLEYLRIEEFVVGPPWRFTLKGKANIACGAALTEKHKVCRPASEHTNFPDMTVYELILALDAVGFEHQETAKKIWTTPYKPPDSEKIWYTRSGSADVNRLYLEALLSADKLFLSLGEEGKPVPHFAKSADYRVLLGMEPAKPRRCKAAPLPTAGPCPDDFGPEKPKRRGRRAKASLARVQRAQATSADSAGESGERAESADDSEGNERLTLIVCVCQLCVCWCAIFTCCSYCIVT